MPGEYLRRVRETLRSGRPIEDRFREFSSATVSFLPGSVCTVLLFDPDTDDFYLRTTTLRISPAMQALAHSADGTLEDLALRERRPVRLSEVNRPASSRLKGEVLLYPLVSANEPLGVFVLQSVSEDGVPAEKIGALGEAVEALSESVGSFLREESAAQRMTKIAAINEAGINIISTLDLARLLKLVATSASLIMEAESCMVRLLDPETGKYAIRESYGVKPDTDPQDLFRLDKKAASALLKGAPSLLVRDLGTEPEWEEFAGTARTLIAFPLKQGNEVIGTISVFDKFPHKTFYPASFTGDDLATFEKYIRYVEKAIGNAIAFERNERLRNLDGTTGLPTLQYFQQRLLHEISRGKRFRRRFVMMICEVVPRVPPRKFSALDHEEQLIRRVAKAIRATLREYDVVSRISEWKFGLILPEAEDGKISALPRIRKAITSEVEAIRKGLPDLKAEVRFGHASYPEDGDDHEKLIFRANVLR